MPPNNVLLEHSCDYSFMYCSGRFHATMIELIVVAETALLTELKIFTVQFFSQLPSAKCWMHLWQDAQWAMLGFTVVPQLSATQMRKVPTEVSNLTCSRSVDLQPFSQKHHAYGSLCTAERLSLPENDLNSIFLLRHLLAASLSLKDEGNQHLQLLRSCAIHPGQIFCCSPT